MHYYLTFLHTRVSFDVADNAHSTFRPIHRFFRHLISDCPNGAATFHVAVRAYDPSTEVDATVWDTPQRIVRRSSAAAFNIDAHVLDRPGRRLYINRNTLLDTPLDAIDDNTFVLRITERSTVQALDFLRDLVIRHEEQHGTVVLHAAGVHRGGEAVIIAGAKGAGKTTTLLSALRRPTWRYFTGDKLFCTVDNGAVTVHPWRDYPYVGIGTIRADPRLERFVRESIDDQIDIYPPTTKILIDPDLFESWLGSGFSAEPKRLSAVLLPEVAPAEPLTVWRLASDNERWAHLNKIVDRQVDTTFFTWQSYLVPDYAQFYRSLAALRATLERIDMIRLRGTLDVDLDAILTAAHTGPRDLRRSIQ